MEHHPEVTKYWHQNENLRADLTRLRAQTHVATVLQENRQRATELERIFKELKAEKEKSEERIAFFFNEIVQGRDNSILSAIDLFCLFDPTMLGQ